MSNLIKFFIVFGIIVCANFVFIPVQAQASWSVWTEPMLANKPQPSYNPTTKASSIALKSAKNEWVGFLLCVRGDETLSGFVPSVASTFTNGADTIADSNVIPYILFNHTTTERANAYEVPGTYPDAAVPYKDVYFNEVRNGTEAGWGQTVAANTTRVFFVEIYIPAGTLAGQYSGSVRLMSNGGALTKDIPVTIDVWNFALPEQWSLKNLWGVYGSYWDFDGTAFGGRNDTKAREYLFNMQKASINHGFFLYGGTNRQTSGPTIADSFTNPYFDGASDQYSWKRFLDGTVPQGYNPKPYPKTSIWGTRDESGEALIYNSTTTMDAWEAWILANNYNDHTLFFDKIVDEPDNLATINAYHSAHVTRHSGEPNRPMEYWTAGGNSYPPDTVFWNDGFKSAWMVSQFYTWYRSHDWGSPYGSPADFASRIATYGDLLFSYTAGDNDQACDIGVYDPSRGIRAAVSESLDAYSRQNAYYFISDWHFGTVGHHSWMTNEGWNHLAAYGMTDGMGNFSVQIPKNIPNGQYQIYASSGAGGNRIVGNSILVSNASGVTSVALPASSVTVGPTLTVTGTLRANEEVRVFISGTGAIDSADYVWSVTDPFGDYKLANNWGLTSASANNGGGLWFYPGRVSGTKYDIGGTHEIPIESYKLKLVRWGAQVYEFAKILETQGKKSTADAQVNRMITFNVPNTIKINPVSEWDNAREVMGNSITGGTTPTCTSFTYSAWSTCTNNTQSRTITTSSPTSCTGGTPILTQSCSSVVVPPLTYTLTTTRAGTGSGTVSGSGISCGTDCSETVVSGTSVTLTAKPATDSTFTGWGGACSGTQTTCTVSVTAATNVLATFTLNEATIETIDTTAPTFSTVVLAQTGNQGLTITWTTSEPATTRLNYGTTATLGLSTQEDTTLTRTHSVTLNKLQRGTTYYVQAYSRDESGNTGTSVVKNVTIAAKPGKVTNPRATAGSVNLSWKLPKVQNFTSITIYRDGTHIATLPATATTYRDTAVNPSTSYKYEIYTVDSDLVTSDPATVSFKTRSGIPRNEAKTATPPQVPNTASATSVGGGVIVTTPTVPTQTTTPRHTFTAGLKLGVTHADVRALQQFLNTHGYNVAQNGPGSQGNETTYYGPATKAAVTRFQQANRLGDATSYGLVGPQTRAKLNAL